MGLHGRRGPTGIGGLLVIFAILNSCLANANAGADGLDSCDVLAGSVASLLPRCVRGRAADLRTPVNAVHFQAIRASSSRSAWGQPWLGSAYPGHAGPLNTYFWLGTQLGLLFAGMYIAVNVAAIGYYLGEGRGEFSVLKHVVVPVLGVIAMIPAILFGVSAA